MSAFRLAAPRFPWWTLAAALSLLPPGAFDSRSLEPAINVWYGDEQHFGRLGNPQPRINILGSVEGTGQVDTVTYSLNGGPARPLSLGVDLRRLARLGDFNIEVDRADLLDGMNEVVIRATRHDGEDLSSLVRVHYTRGRVWPLPYAIDWSTAERVQDAAEIMDGLWTLTPQGVRTAAPYYDRTIAIGDMEWTDYEVFTSVVFHRMLAPEIVPKGPPFSMHGHASLQFRWVGHHDDGKQPRVKWHPAGGLAMLRTSADSEVHRWIWHGGESGILAQETDGRRLEVGRRHFFRARVETLPGRKTRYSAKGWDAGDQEPPDWNLVSVDGAQDVQSGSLLLVAHHSDVTFGDVVIKPL